MFCRSRQGKRVGAIATLILFAAAAAPATADIRPLIKGDPAAKPDPAANAEPRIQVIHSHVLRKSQIHIPRNLLPGEKVGGITSPMRTIVAGTAMSAGAALCGLVLLRRRGVGSGKLTALVVAGSALTGAGYVFANGAAPPAPMPTVLVEGRPVEVRLLDQGNTIIVVLDRQAVIKDAAPVPEKSPAIPPR